MKSIQMLGWLMVAVSSLFYLNTPSLIPVVGLS